VKKTSSLQFMEKMREISLTKYIKNVMITIRYDTIRYDTQYYD
jgi:hypothetical protein